MFLYQLMSPLNKIYPILTELNFFSHYVHEHKHSRHKNREGYTWKKYKYIFFHEYLKNMVEKACDVSYILYNDYLTCKKLPYVWKSSITGSNPVKRFSAVGASLISSRAFIHLSQVRRSPSSNSPFGFSGMYLWMIWNVSIMSELLFSS